MNRGAKSTALRPRGHLIGAREKPAASGATFETLDPATGRPLAALARGGPEDVDRAVRAARAAQPEWERMDPMDRTRLLLRMAELVVGIEAVF